jgi:ABC-type bacteriocin/lantibiotic exporter with double-glycine peptidase domain
MLIDGVRLNILFFGGLFVLSGQLTIAILILYIYLLGLVVAALSSINGLTSTITENYIYVEKLWDTFDNASHIKNYTYGSEFFYKKGNIFIDKLHYQYDQDIIFDDFSLNLLGGKTTAFVGMSGCGKTTLAKLISGYLTPQKGKILIDEQNLSVLKLISYYKHIGYLTQDPSVFDGTVYQNLTNAVDERVVKACTRSSFGYVASTVRTSPPLVNI